MSGDEKTRENQTPPGNNTQEPDPYANPFAMPGDPGNAAAPAQENTPPEPEQSSPEPQETAPPQPADTSLDVAPGLRQPEPTSRPEDPQIMTGEQPVTTLDMTGQSATQPDAPSDIEGENAPEAPSPAAFEPPIADNSVPEHMQPGGGDENMASDTPSKPQPTEPPIPPQTAADTQPAPEFSAAPSELQTSEAAPTAPSPEELPTNTLPEPPAEPEPVTFSDPSEDMPHIEPPGAEASLAASQTNLPPEPPAEPEPKAGEAAAFMDTSSPTPESKPQPISDSPSEDLAMNRWSTIESGGEEQTQPTPSAPEPPLETSPEVVSPPEGQPETLQPAQPETPAELTAPPEPVQATPPQPELTPPAEPSQTEQVEIPSPQPEIPPLPENDRTQATTPEMPASPEPLETRPPTPEPQGEVQQLPGQLPEYGEMASPFSDSTGGAPPNQSPPAPQPEPVPQQQAPVAEMPSAPPQGSSPFADAPVEGGESPVKPEAPFNPAPSEAPEAFTNAPPETTPPDPSPPMPPNQSPSVSETMDSMPGSRSSWSDVETGADEPVPPVSETMQQSAPPDSPTGHTPPPPPADTATPETAPEMSNPAFDPQEVQPSAAQMPQAPSPTPPTGQSFTSSWSNVESGKDINPEEAQGIDPLAAATAATSNIDSGHGEGLAMEQQAGASGTKRRFGAQADDHQEDMPDFIAAKNDPNQQFASFMSRFGAMLLDGFIQTIILIALLVIIQMALGASASMVGTLLTGFFWLIYATMLEGGKHQATFGKRICGIKVVQSSGEKVSISKALIRNILKIVSSIPIFLGFIMALFTRRKQTLHDIVAKTEVHRYKQSKFWKFFIIFFLINALLFSGAFFLLGAALFSAFTGDGVAPVEAPTKNSSSGKPPIGAPPIAPPPAVQPPELPEVVTDVGVAPPPIPDNQPGNIGVPPVPQPAQPIGMPPGRSMDPPPPPPPPMPGEGSGIPPMPTGAVPPPPAPIGTNPSTSTQDRALPPAKQVNLPRNIYASSGRSMEVPPLPYKVAGEQYDKILQSELVVFEGPYVYNAGPFALRLGQTQSRNGSVELPLHGRFSGLMNVESGKGGTVTIDISSVQDIAGNDIYAENADFESGIFTEIDLEPLQQGDVAGVRNIQLDTMRELGNIGLVEGEVHLALPINVDVLQYRVDSMQDRFTPTAYEGVTVSFEDQGTVQSARITFPPRMADRIVGVLAYDARSQLIERTSMSASGDIKTYGFDPDFEIKAIQVLIAGEVFERRIPFTIQAE